VRLIALAAALAALGASPGCASAPPPPGNASGEYLGARFAARFNELDDAARAFARAHERAPDETAILKDAFFYRIAAGDMAAAAVLAERIVATSPEQDDGLARNVIAAARIRLGDFEAARRMLRGDISSPFLKSIARLLDVAIERETAGAAAALELLKNPAPGAFTGLNALHAAFLTEAAGDVATAKAAYQESMKIGDVLSARAYGAFLERSDAAAAQEYYALLAERNGPALRLARDGQARLDRGTPSTAFTTASARQSGAAAFYVFAQAMLQQAAEERDRAELAGFNVGAPRYTFPLALARIAAWLDPHSNEAAFLVGSILNAYGDFAGAAAAFRTVAAGSPLFAEARMAIAAGLAAEERRREAIAVVVAALRRDPKSFDLRLALAGHYDLAGDHARAAAIYDGLIADLADPPKGDDWRYFLARGAARLELGDWARAEFDLKRAVELGPEQATALNYLGYSWAERGLHLEEAFRLIDKAVALEPQSGAILDSLGWAQYQLGRYQEAAVNLEKAAALEPSDPTITDHLGDAYWRLGRPAEARFQWRRALELGPKAAEKAKIAEKLADGLAPVAATRAADGGT
jgi:Flp pilus assembly protein TadD